MQFSNCGTRKLPCSLLKQTRSKLYTVRKPELPIKRKLPWKLHILPRLQIRRLGLNQLNKSKSDVINVK